MSLFFDLEKWKKGQKKMRSVFGKIQKIVKIFRHFLFLFPFTESQSWIMTCTSNCRNCTFSFLCYKLAKKLCNFEFKNVLTAGARFVAFFFTKSKHVLWDDYEKWMRFFRGLQFFFENTYFGKTRFFSYFSLFISEKWKKETVQKAEPSLSLFLRLQLFFSWILAYLNWYEN